MSDDTDWEKAKRAAKKTTEGSNGFIKGNKLYSMNTGHNYQIKFNASTATKVSIWDKTARSARAAKKGLPAKGDWVMRLDRPHHGAEFNHVNINPAISGMKKTSNGVQRPYDPHVSLPPGGLAAGDGVAKFCKVVNKVNKVAVPLAIALDVASTGIAVYEDVKNGTTRNTVETVASVAGGWGGGYGGAVGGAAIGTAFLPGIGTIIGGIVGGIGGGIGGALGLSYAVDAVGDACDYDIEDVKCKKCGKWFKVRKYLGDEQLQLCRNCA